MVPSSDVILWGILPANSVSTVNAPSLPVGELPFTLEKELSKTSRPTSRYVRSHFHYEDKGWVSDLKKKGPNVQSQNEG